MRRGWRPSLRSFMGQITLPLDERNEILAKVKLGREMMVEINQYTSAVPEWAKVDPFGQVQPKFDSALDRAFNVSDAVRDIETSLLTEGPWTRLNESENVALTTWFGGIEEMYSFYQGAKSAQSADVRVAFAAGVVGILYTIAIMGA